MIADRTAQVPNRREFLRWSATLASGVVVPGSFTACSRENTKQSAMLQQTFVQPTLLQAENGVLDITLTASYLSTTLQGSDPGKHYPVSLRAYGYNHLGPACTGPTLVIKGGDQLRIRLVNHLPVNPPLAAFRDPSNYLNPNTTNLHTHGLHVFPGIYSDRTPAEYGDFVVDPNGRGVQPRGDSRQYVYRIPENHPEGPFYYHPQYHGSSAIQAASLMAGAIMVRGPVDELPEMAQAEELIFLFQAPYFANSSISKFDGVNDGSLEKFSQLAVHPTGQGIRSTANGHLDIQPVLINGVRQPTIVMKSGEVQRWRFINTQVFNYLNISMDGHEMYAYTNDGWGRSAYQKYSESERSGANGIVLAPGNRSSVLIKAAKPGTYMLRSLPFMLAHGKSEMTLPGDILALIVVVDVPKPMELPPVPLPVSDFLRPITDDEFARAGGRKRSVVFNMAGNELPDSSRSVESTVLNAIAQAKSMASEGKKRLMNQLALAAGELSRVTGARIDGPEYESARVVPDYPYQLQPANVIAQNVILGAVEEWTVFNCNEIAQSFHIHVNPMYIIKVNGVAIDPYWCDTVSLPAGGTQEMPTSVTFRMRFQDFVGPYILHSQMLQYSDLGMVQRVTVMPAE